MAASSHQSDSVASGAHSRPRSFHVMTKPVGPICNLDCKYCFYLEKENLYPGKSDWRMKDEMLESYVRQHIAAQDGAEVTFAWQGGEPTLTGIEFFRRAVELQQRYADGRKIANAIQTNGTLLDDAWCDFLKRNNFLVGLSIDGPRRFHDLYRVDKEGQPTFDRVLAGMRLLKKYGVDFNTLCVVNRANSTAPLDVYRFLKSEGSGYIQFIPLVERVGSGNLHFAQPPALAEGGRVKLRVVSDANETGGAEVTPWSVEPLAYGEFLCAIFDHWVRRDVGRVFVQIFDVQLGIWAGYGSSLCVFGETCGNALALEHNGDLYSCDHYVYPEYHLGNIATTSLAEMAGSLRQRKFGADKRDTLPKYCRECDVKFACNGECPKHRFLNAPDGEPGLNYLCAGYKRFLGHIDPTMRAMATLVRSGRPAADIMKRIADAERMPDSAVGRNVLCPCGSGRKYKKCCGAA